MVKKKPCCFCRKWFMPDPRVGDRQKACSRSECQKKRRIRTQANWRERNPEYERARWLRDRSNKAEAADKAKNEPPTPGKKLPRRPSPIRMVGKLRKVPWETIQDEIGVQVTDAIAVTALLIIKATQDQRRPQTIDNKEEPAPLQ